MTRWDIEVDFLIVGSGAAGMTAALTAHAGGLNALVVEKAAYYGGTTAFSGGVVWIPDNHLMKRYGIPDSFDDGMTYLSQLIGPGVPRSKLAAYLNEAPKMLKFMEAQTLVRFESAPEYADYYPELPGGKPGGRSLDPIPFTRRKLGALEAEMRPPLNGPMLDQFTMTAKEAHILLNLNLVSFIHILKRMAQFWLDIPFRLRRKPDNRLTLGTALVGRLRKSMELRGIPLWLNTAARELIIENGVVVGIEVQQGERSLRIRSRNGILMAAGGFERNGAMRKQYQRAPITDEWTVACPDNTGDGINMGLKAGAGLGFMECAWWTPTMVLPGGRAEALIIGKSMPGCIMVNKAGKRFTNDAGPYEDVVKGQYLAHSEASPAIPCYLIFDAKYRQKYPLGLAIRPGKVQPDSQVPKHLWESGWIRKAETLEELAALWDIDAAGLKATIERVNCFARNGKDEDFGRGDSITDRYYSDVRVKPNSCMAPIETAPYYGIELYPGDLGTKGGLLTDEYARVLDEQGQVIPGLYAAGNCSAAVMGDSYPGAGATLGPAMTFGYVAAQHAASERG